jgi:subtilisin family serine protease
MRTLLKFLIAALFLAPITLLSQPNLGLRSQKEKRVKIPNEYIVTLKEGEDPNAVAATHSMKPKHVFKHAFNGFHGTLNDNQVARLRADPRVLRVEQDAVVTTDAVDWGLDRLDQRQLPLNGVYNHTYNGAGVTAYVIDCGILYGHQEFGGRAIKGYDYYGGDGSDCYGHGTHVAGTIGGANYGVAPGVTLVAIKVMDCTGNGTTSSVIAGIDWIISNKRLPAVANLSLGGPTSSSLNQAVTNLVNAGVVVCVAAGNSTVDACTTSPADDPDVITVGATDQNDAKASFSNYGSCVDIFAPGVSIISSYYTSTSAYVYMSGTSMASPHVAGVAALELQHYPSLPARAVRDSLFKHATKGIVTSSSSTNNHLLYSYEQNDPPSTPPPTATQPTANFVQSCTNLACTFSDRSTDIGGTITSWNWNFGNGVTSTAQNPSYSYPSAGTYNVTLTVRDNTGATNTKTQAVTVSAAVATSQVTANFAQNCSSLACTFTDQSTDAGGTINSWSWNFGNGVTSTVRNPSYSYPSAGTYTVTLTVRDNLGTSSTKSQTVTVSTPPVANTNITLSAYGYYYYGRDYVRITYSGVTTQYADVYRNGIKIGTVSNTGSATDATGVYGSATFTYRVCNQGSTNVCSPYVTVKF